LAQFDEHIQQANKNLHFLEYINKCESEFCDWHVTGCFYCAVHLVNAHLSLHNMQYRKHVDVKDALNPKNQTSLSSGTALPDNEYLAYTKLQSLSRRSRYLVNEKDGNLSSTTASLTYEVHLKKALRHLHTLINFFTRKYNLTKIELIQIKCDGVNKGDLCFTK
jgi:hypothetical protein